MIQRLSAKVKTLISGNAGETLVESLISVLIVAATMLMLATAIVTAGNVNKTSEQNNASFDSSKSSTLKDLVVTVDGESASNVNGKLYEGEDSSSDGPSYTYVYYTVGE